MRRSVDPRPLHSDELLIVDKRLRGWVVEYHKTDPSSSGIMSSMSALAAKVAASG